MIVDSCGAYGRRGAPPPHARARTLGRGCHGEREAAHDDQRAGGARRSPRRRTLAWSTTREAYCRGPRRTSLGLRRQVGPGLGLAIARVFAAQGYATAILSRTKSRLDQFATEVCALLTQLDALAHERLRRDGHPATGVLSRAFACDMLQQHTIHQAIADIQAAWPDRLIGTCAYNGSIRKRGEFLRLHMDQLKESIDASVCVPCCSLSFAFFTFAQLTLSKMIEHNQGGTLLVTGATSSVRGREGFVPFAAASTYIHTHGTEGALRNMCQVRAHTTDAVARSRIRREERARGSYHRRWPHRIQDGARVLQAAHERALYRRKRTQHVWD